LRIRNDSRNAHKTIDRSLHKKKSSAQKLEGTDALESHHQCGGFEVGPDPFFSAAYHSLFVVYSSFFTPWKPMEGPGLFGPLALHLRPIAMAAAAGLSVTLFPVLWFIGIPTAKIPT